MNSKKIVIWRSSLALVIGFIVVFLGSTLIPALLLPKIFGYSPKASETTFMFNFVDFWISFMFTMLGGYAAAKLSKAYPLIHSFLASMVYFSLSLYLYMSYNLVGSEWLKPIIFLIKVPVAAVIGAYFYKKYNKALNKDATKVAPIS